MNKFTVICSAIVVIILVLFAFETYNNQSQFEGFIVVERGYIDNDIEQIIMYDPDTIVMYSYLKTMYSGGLTIIYDVDGSPKLYSVSD